MTRADIFHKLGGFDGRFFMFVEDADYCWRALLVGKDVQVAPDALVVHEGGAAAPGGYPMDEGVETTLFRVSHRERNTLAMLLKCYGGRIAVPAAFLYVLQTLATAVFLTTVRKPRTARAIVAGLVWNARALRTTLELRRQVQATRRVSDAAVLARMHRGLRKVDIVVRYGIPVVREEPAPRCGR